MAELTTLARPYAKAAFEFADDNAALDHWSGALQSLAAVVAETRVADRLSDPLATSEQHAQTLVDLMGDSIDGKIQNFVQNLAANKRLGLLAEISSLFDLMKSNREQVLDVRISSAYELSDQQEKTLAEALGKNLRRAVTLECEVDESLIGGAFINAGDTIIDGSVRGRLTKLTETMNS